MNELTKTRLFAILSETSQKVLTSEMQNAYVDFEKDIRAICDSGDRTSVYRSLDATRIELVHLDSFYQYGLEKNATKKTYLSKTLALVTSELELLRMRIKYPEQFVQSEPTFQSELHLSSSGNIGIIGLAEIAVALHLSKCISNANGHPAPLSEISRVFECAFNVNFGDIYGKQNKIFDRKRYNLTKALDFLKECIIKKDTSLLNQ